MTIVPDVEMAHEDAAMPVGGLLPTVAEHVKLVVKPAPDNVMVLVEYAAAGLTAVALGAALIVNGWALFGPSIVATAEVLVVTAALDTVAAVPYATEGTVHENDAAGTAAKVMVIVKLPASMLAVPAPIPPVQLTA